MAKIIRVRIQNFQSLKDITFEPDPHVTTIIGESDVGKSAVMRALRLAFENTAPNGDYISFGAKNAIVSVWFDNGWKVVRTKGKENAYSIQLNDNKAEEFKNFGKEIPPEVKSVIGFQPITIGDDDYSINFSKQIGKHFLLGERDSIKAKFIGQLSDVNLMDVVLSDINSSIRSEAQELKRTESDLEAANIEVKKFASLGELERLKTLLDTQTKEIDDKTEKWSALSDIREMLLRGDESRVNLKRKIDKLEPRIALDVSTMTSLSVELSSLKNLLTKSTALGLEAEQLESRRRVLDLAASLDVATLKELFNKSTRLNSLLAKQQNQETRLEQLTLSSQRNDILIELEIKDISALQEKKVKLTELLSKVRDVIAKRKGLTDRLEEAKALVSTLDEELVVLKKDIPDSCPYCGTTISEDQEHYMLHEATKQ